MANNLTKPLFYGAFLLAVVKIYALEPNPAEIAPNQPRDISSFAALFAKSPFAMASISNQSPLSQRYVITGAMMIDDTPHVFLLDKTTQSRLTISANEPDGGVSLVSLQNNPDTSLMRATIQAGSDTGVVAFEKTSSVPEGSPAGPDASAAANAQPPPAPEGANPPAAAQAPPSTGMTQSNLPAPPPRRPVIRRPAPIVPAAAQQSSTP